MFIRNPSHSFTSISLFAQNGGDQTVSAPPVFYQGSTIQLDTVLSVDGVPLDLSEYRLDFFLKKATEADNILYRTEILEKAPGQNDGVFRVTLPKAVGNKLRPGVYYFAFQITQKASQHIFSPYTGTFTIELSAASPNPNLTHADGEPTALGPDGAADAVITPAEITGPNTPDIGRPF